LWRLLLLLQAWAKANASGQILAATVAADAGIDLSAKVKSACHFALQKSVKSSHSLKVNMEKPCYIYQVHARVPMDDGVEVIWNGGHFVANELLTLKPYFLGEASAASPAPSGSLSVTGSAHCEVPD
jgi:hypothetical protein